MSFLNANANQVGEGAAQVVEAIDFAPVDVARAVMRALLPEIANVACAKWLKS